ncbi:MAG TPA: asparagine synthase C-terminal domain-containing protein [Roseateles sp.]
MFRYLAFCWEVANPEQADLAHQLEQSLLARGWRAAFQMSGHRVFMIGNVRGVNDAYPLAANQGVILGRVFRRGAMPSRGDGDVELTDLEAQRIVHTDGQSLVDHFWGRYVAFLPSWTGVPRVLRDPTGTLPCYSVEVRGIAIVFSWLDDLFAILDITAPPVDWDAVAAHMVLGQVSGRETLLRGVTQVLAGELVPLARRSGSPKQLWDAVAQAASPSMMSESEAAARLRDTVAACVQSWSSCYDGIVLRLSGGVDSAILLGNLVADRNSDSTVCLNYHLPGTDSDERTYARLAASLNEVELVEGTIDDGYRLEDVLDVARTPTPANYLGFMGTGRNDAEVAAARGASAVFNGAGGDQLFFEVCCAWPAADYFKLRGVDLGFLSATLDAARLGNVSFWKALKQAVKDRSFHGDPTRRAARYLTLMDTAAIDAALKVASRFIHPAWLAAHDLPIGKFNQLGMLICPFEYYNHYLRDAAPERVQPLMSQPILELCLAIRTYVLTQGGRGRALARQAFADQIPAEIASRRSKGGTATYIAKVLQRNLPFAREMLLDGLLASRGLLDRRRVEATLAGSLASKAGYVTEIHAYIATEAWLRRATTTTSPRDI